MLCLGKREDYDHLGGVSIAVARGTSKCSLRRFSPALHIVRFAFGPIGTFSSRTLGGSLGFDGFFRITGCF